LKKNLEKKPRKNPENTPYQSSTPPDPWWSGRLAADVALASYLSSLLQTADIQASICNIDRDTLIEIHEPLIQYFNV
jgi:hypothetical protein